MNIIISRNFDTKTHTHITMYMYKISQANNYTHIMLQLNTMKPKNNPSEKLSYYQNKST